MNGAPDRSSVRTGARLAPIQPRVNRLAGFEGAELGISISRAKAVMLDRPGMLIRMAKRSERLAWASIDPENCRFDGHDLAIDLLEALSIGRFNSGSVRAFPRFLAAVRSFTRASRAT